MTPTANVGGINPTIVAIDQSVLSYAPAAIVAVQAAEITNASGATKLQSTVSTILAGSQALESAPNPNVAGIAALVNLVVSIFNATGMFNHKTKTVSAPPTPSLPVSSVRAGTSD